MNDIGFYLFTAYSDKFKRMSDAQFGLLVRLLLEYKATGVVPEIDDAAVGIAFDVIKADVDKQAEAYKKKADAGRNGGNAKAEASKSKQTVAEASTGKQDVANDTNKNKKENKKEIEREIETEKEIDNSREISPSEIQREAAKKFVPPTLEQIQDFCAERCSSVDPVVFWEYFTNGDWKDSKGKKVRNWKQKLITWEKFDTKNNRASPRERAEQALREVDSWV
jgi:hypothetical protein